MGLVLCRREGIARDPSRYPRRGRKARHQDELLVRDRQAISRRESRLPRSLLLIQADHLVTPVFQISSLPLYVSSISISSLFPPTRTCGTRLQLPSSLRRSSVSLPSVLPPHRHPTRCVSANSEHVPRSISLRSRGLMNSAARTIRSRSSLFALSRLSRRGALGGC